jgi:hypothetical protein
LHKISTSIRRALRWVYVLLVPDPLAPRVMIHSIFPNWPQVLKNKKNYSFTLLDIKYANQKYKLIECSTEAVNCKTAEHLGVEAKSQIQLFTKTGEIFADLVIPKGFTLATP